MMKDNSRVVKRASRGKVEKEARFPFPKDSVRLPSGSEYIRKYRLDARDAYERADIPTIRDEAWRRTDLRNLKPANFHLYQNDMEEQDAEIPERFLKPLNEDQHGSQIILNGNALVKELDDELSEKGIIFTDLQDAEENYPQEVEKIMGRIIKPSEGKFAAMAAAFAQTGVLLYVPKGVKIEKPLHSLIWGSGVGTAQISHVLVYLDEGSEATFVHEAASGDRGDGSMLHVGLVEVFVGAGANLKFVELQSWGEHVWNITHERVRVEQDASLEWVFGSIGSRLTKNFADLELAGKGSSGKVSGFYFTHKRQHLDHDTQQNHLAPNTSSDLLFKGALLDDSRSVWQGMIYVAPGADKTDGYQANRNLVLSRNARADSIPGLEILADDVRCTHGATVGKLDKDQVFYLLSRGIPLEEAELLIVEGFFDPIMKRIPFEGVRERFQEAIHKKMESYRHL